MWIKWKGSEVRTSQFTVSALLAGSGGGIDRILQQIATVGVTQLSLKLVSFLMQSTAKHVPFPSQYTTALLGQSFLNIEASRSHSGTPQSVGLLQTSDQQASGRRLTS